MPLLPLSGRGESGLEGSDFWLDIDLDPSDLRGVGMADMRREMEPRETLERLRLPFGSGVVEREAASYSRSDWEVEARVW